MRKLSAANQEQLLNTLETRFERNSRRHEHLEWNTILKKLNAQPEKLWSLNEMEKTGGEPDVIGFNSETDTYIFCDCSPESPKGRRSICYDQQGLDSRKEFKPKNSAVEMAKEMGVELINEEQYRTLQSIEKFDTKSSSWLKTPESIRKLGGALFGDFRYNTVFIYHNGAESYYAGRSFRGQVYI